MKKIFKKVPIIVWILIILIGVISIIFYFKPFLICPSGLHKKIYFSQYRNSFYCRNNNYESLIVKIWNSDGHLIRDCNNGKCIEYDSNGSFNFITGVKNFIKGIWSWYQPGDMEKVWNGKIGKYGEIIPNGPYYEYKNGILITSGTKIGLYKGIGEWYYYNEDGSLKIIVDYGDGIDGNVFNGGYGDIFNRYYDGNFSYFYKNGNPSVKGEYLSGYATGLRTRYDKNGNITNIYDYNKRSIKCPKGYNEVILNNSGYIFAQFCENKEGIRSGEYISFYPNNGSVLQHGTFSNDMKEGLRKDYIRNGVLSSKRYYINDILEGKYESYHDNGEISSSFYIISGREDFINHPNVTYYKNGNINSIITKNNEYIGGYENGRVKIRGKYNNLHEMIGTRYYYKENGKLDYKEIYDHGFIVK